MATDKYNGETENDSTIVINVGYTQLWLTDT